MMKTKIFALTLCCAFFIGNSVADTQHTEQAQSNAQQQSPHQFETLDQRFSYAYGVDLARKFSSQNVDIDVNLMVAAMRSVLSKQKPLMDDGEVQATIQAYTEIYAQKKEAAWKAASVQNKTKSDEFLNKNKQQPSVTETASGLQYKVLAEGDGKSFPTLDDEVVVHYTARFTDGTVFNNTYEQGDPYSETVSALIPGWSEALQLMSKGAHWELYVPPDIAYGESGSGDIIGPNQVLIFDIKLLDINS